MFLSIWTSLLILIICYFASILWSLRRNIALAKQSGLKYTITPVHISHKGWLATQNVLLIFLRKLPESWTSSWLPLLIFARVWHAGHEPFSLIGADTFLAVSPSQIVLWTCDAEAIQQICERRKDFPKPVGDMGMLNIHGPTVTGTEGEESRRYRRITAGSFSTRTYEKTWKESLIQARELFLRLKKLEDKRRLNRELERMTLNVVSNVCCGTGEGADVSSTKPPTSRAGRKHKMTYQEAFGTSADYMGAIYIIPHFILKHSPFSSHKLAWRSFIEWRWYMEDLVKGQRDTRLLGQETQNLLESLVAAGDDEEKGRISESAILGNIWVFVLGGYHTSANTLHFIFILLAIRPEIQRELQKSLDDYFGDRPPSSWTHEVDFPALLNGHLGAVIAETVRLFGVLPFIPKSTGSIAQTLAIDGSVYTVPAETMMLINTSAVHRNPRYWPINSPQPGEKAPFPVSNWDPWRWMQNQNGKGLLIPRPGSYISFSEGARQCIGKRFAQVELCAVLARVLKEGSIELAVRGGDSKEGSLAWSQARDHAVKELSDGVGFGMSLELFGKVELSIVSRD